MEKILSLQTLPLDLEELLGVALTSNLSVTCTGCSCNSDGCCPTQAL